MSYEYGGQGLYREAFEAWRVWCRRKGVTFAIPSEEHSRVAVNPITGDGTVRLGNASGTIAKYRYSRRNRQMTQEAQ